MQQQSNSIVPNTIHDIMKLKSRELFFNPPPLRPRTKTKPPAEANPKVRPQKSVRIMDDEINRSTRDKMINYLKTYKTNDELLNFILQPRIRIRSSSMPVRPKSGSSTRHNSGQAAHLGNSSHPNEETLFLSRRKLDTVIPENTRRPDNLNNLTSKPDIQMVAPNLKISTDSQVKLTGIVQGLSVERKRRPSSFIFYDATGDESSDSFYDMESSSRRF